jgi:hypothetical protein
MLGNSHALPPPPSSFSINSLPSNFHTSYWLDIPDNFHKKHPHMMINNTMQHLPISIIIGNHLFTPSLLLFHSTKLYAGLTGDEMVIAYTNCPLIKIAYQKCQYSIASSFQLPSSLIAQRDLTHA